MKKWALVPAVVYMVIINILLVGSPIDHYLVDLTVYFPIAVIIFLVVWGIGSLGRRLVERR